MTSIETPLSDIRQVRIFGFIGWRCSHNYCLGVYEENLKTSVNQLRSLELFELLNAKNKALDNGKHKKKDIRSKKSLPPLKNTRKKKKAPLNPFFQMVLNKASSQRKKFSLRHSMIEPLNNNVFDPSGIDFQKVADHFIDKYQC